MEISDLISIGVIKKVIGNGGIISAIPDTLFQSITLLFQSFLSSSLMKTVRFETIDTIELKDKKII